VSIIDFLVVTPRYAKASRLRTIALQRAAARRRSGTRQQSFPCVSYLDHARFIMVVSVMAAIEGGQIDAMKPRNGTSQK